MPTVRRPEFLTTNFHALLEKKGSLSPSKMDLHLVSFMIFRGIQKLHFIVGLASKSVLIWA